MIAFNGAVIYDCAADRILSKRSLPIEHVQELFESAKKKNLYVQTYTSTEGKLLATTYQNFEIGETEIISFAESQADSQVVRGYQFFKVYDETRLEYILIAGGGSDDVYMVGKMPSGVRQ